MNFDSIFSALEKRLPCKNKELYVVGFSGGPDSLCLVHALYQNSFNFIAAHFNHQLRESAEKEVVYLKNYCHDMGILFESQSRNIKEISKNKKKGIEEVARECRYEFLFQIANKRNASAVLTAHTLDDQVETILMHIIRGCGLTGLSGMETNTLVSYHPSIPLVRPFLQIEKSEILAYCEHFQLKPVIDESNTDTRYFRNWIRHKVLPLLREKNPSINKTLSRLATIARDEHSVLIEYAEKIKNEIIEKTADGIVLKKNKFCELSVGLQRAILLLAFSEFDLIVERIDQDFIESVRNVILYPPKTNYFQPIDQIEIWFEENHLLISLRQNLHSSIETRETINKPEDNNSTFVKEMQPFGIQAEIAIFLNVQPLPINREKTSLTQYFDAEKILWPIEIRYLKAGDFFSPLGMNGKTQKISDFLINRKIPRRKRKEILVITSSGVVIWVLGFQIADTVKVTKSTKQIAKISIENINH